MLARSWQANQVMLYGESGPVGGGTICGWMLVQETLPSKFHCFLCFVLISYSHRKPLLNPTAIANGSILKSNNSVSYESCDLGQAIEFLWDF